MWRIQPEVGERGVDEWLHELTRQQVRHIGLKNGPEATVSPMLIA